MSILDTFSRRRGRPLKAVADATAAAAKADQDLVKLSARRVDLASRHEAATKALALARDGRRSALVNDPDADADALSRAVRDAEDTASIFADALRDIDQQIEALASQKAGQELQAKREQVAGQYDAIGDAFAEAAAELDSAAVIFVKAFHKLEKAVPDDFALIEIDWPDYSRKFGPATPTELAAVVLAEALYNQIPGAFSYRSDASKLLRFDRLSYTPSPNMYDSPAKAQSATEAAAKLLVDRVHKHAKSVRVGEIDIVSGRKLPPVAEPVIEEPIFSYVWVFATANFRFANSAKSWELCGSHVRVSVPVPVADAAVKAGVALRTDTPEGLEAWQDHARYSKTTLPLSSGPLYFDDCHDLGDPCNFANGAVVPPPRGHASLAQAA